MLEAINEAECGFIPIKTTTISRCPNFVQPYVFISVLIYEVYSVGWGTCMKRSQENVRPLDRLESRAAGPRRRHRQHSERRRDWARRNTRQGERSRAWQRSRTRWALLFMLFVHWLQFSGRLLIFKKLIYPRDCRFKKIKIKNSVWKVDKLMIVLRILLTVQV